MEIMLEGIVLIVGNYGSGKTEISINLAVNRKQAGVDVRLADLDLVNPYFRTREAASQLKALGIDLVLPPTQYLQADLPILDPAVAGLIQSPGQLTILDVGGDDAGATVLASLGDVFKQKTVQVLQVVNPYRPGTDTVEGCLLMRRRIETAAKLPINGIVGNANLMEETTPAHIYRGYDFVKDVEAKSGLALEFVTAPFELIPRLDQKRFDCPLLVIKRQLVPPWRKAVRLDN